ncbi:sigma-70 family RNA polymerase sigma factor [Anaerotignum lactatifermentans]|uniref:Sigma-70 family RNA polymerase sigma factor n=1 Tax=Anaerotignum lactatifermentans TaxID=160404 RepID=A0ABS2G9S1_9FIRM|nr:sigma-70 family RNA polymerase sigma factor [Anaerotignum lactatifermentans]MBM6829080.1 sigma-70 family RNA polymerase sigma factor [Anaerotignum lactatifermentans]MBM6877313.1 sigma-70 family RNA polymerase sigma factor [Anaerotignum lactatifermentans]MBM6950684.1 sigma-70 family RNA polymerase sigma factor [Anaerotignum lactatifermentans]
MKSRKEQQIEEILLRRYDRYYRLAFGYVKNQQDALDIVQESACRAIRECGKVRNTEYMETWVYRIVVNTSLEFLRKQKREDLTEEVIELHPPSGDGKEELEMIFSRWTLRDVLEKLSPKEKSVVMLRFFEDCRLEEIAQITGENLNTVKARLYRALRKMRTGMGEKNGR